IAGDGTISTENGPVGKLGVVTVDDTNQLMPEGGKLYRAAAGTTPVALPKVTQGVVESSNVQPITELTRMMQTEKEFQFVSQFIESEGQRQQSAIDKIVPQQG
ncbi:MAG: flagellar basal body rod C-terminal domain-containing protein, partial [Janthinobacterium lividum]